MITKETFVKLLDKRNLKYNIEDSGLIVLVLDNGSKAVIAGDSLCWLEPSTVNPTQTECAPRISLSDAEPEDVEKALDKMVAEFTRRGYIKPVEKAAARTSAKAPSERAKNRNVDAGEVYSLLDTLRKATEAQLTTPSKYNNSVVMFILDNFKEALALEE